MAVVDASGGLNDVVHYTIKLRGTRKREPEAVLRALYLPIDSDLLAIHPRKLMVQLKLSVLAIQSTSIIRIGLADL